MAGTRQQAIDALDSINLKAPKKADGTKLVIDNHPELADEYLALKDQVDELKEQMEGIRKRMVDIAAPRRLTREKNGDFFSTCVFRSSNEEREVLVLWSDRYSTLDPDHEAVLKQALGSHYNMLLKRTVSVKVTDEATVDALKSFLGETKYNKLAKFLVVQDKLAFTPKFMSRRAELRAAFDERTNEGIDKLIAQVQAMPTIRAQVTPKKK
jgi:hypothetical protein